MIGDHCFVTAVRPNNPASEKLMPGDEVIGWEGYAPAKGHTLENGLSVQRPLLASHSAPGGSRSRRR